MGRCLIVSLSHEIKFGRPSAASWSHDLICSSSGVTLSSHDLANTSALVAIVGIGNEEGLPPTGDILLSNLFLGTFSKGPSPLSPPSPPSESEALLSTRMGLLVMGVVWESISVMSWETGDLWVR